MTKAPARQPDDLRRIGAFLDARAAETGAARNTLLAYGRDLADLAAFAAARDTPLAALSREQIEDYLARCEAEGLSTATRARRLSAIRQFTRFALEEGWREDDPAIRLSGPGRSKRLPRVLAQDDVGALLAAVRDHGPTDEDRLRNTAAGLAASLRGMGTGAMTPLWDALPEATWLVGEFDAKCRGIAERVGTPVVIPGAGHAAHLEQPYAVARVIAEAVGA